MQFVLVVARPISNSERFLQVHECDDIGDDEMKGRGFKSISILIRDKRYKRDHGKELLSAEKSVLLLTKQIDDESSVVGEKKNPRLYERITRCSLVHALSLCFASSECELLLCSGNPFTCELRRILQDCRFI